MLSSLRVGNVRLFEGEKWEFLLPSLSVFCGTNSAGKSTLLKTPLLLRQSFGINEGLELSDGQLRLTGTQVDVGDFASFVSHRDVQRDVHLGVSIEDKMQRAAVRTLQWLKVRGTKHTFIPKSSDDQWVNYTLRANYRFGVARPETSEKDRAGRLSGDSPVDGVRVVLKSSDYEIRVGRDKLLKWTVGLTPAPTGSRDNRPRYHIIVPLAYFRWAGGLEMMDIRIPKDVEHLSLRTTLQGVLPQGILERVKPTLAQQKTQKEQKPQYGVWPLPPIIAEALEDLQRALTNIHYLGPLRSAAKRYYVAQSASGPGMDPTGDFLPYVLRDQATTLVSYCRPGTQNSVRKPLQYALNDWLAYLRTGQTVEGDELDEIGISTTKHVLVELEVRSPDGSESHALADSGFGYSQVLPLLVRGLLAPRHSTLIVEQPELHLNPALQVRLSEFFVALARADKQVLLETHSEHIVNGMRALAAEATDSKVPCAVFFIDAEGPRPTIHELSVKEDGTVDDWPRTFFGEAAVLRARILRAQKKFLPTSSSGE